MRNGITSLADHRLARAVQNGPLHLPGFKHLGRGVAPQIVEDVGRRAISHWRAKTSEAHGAVAAETFREADAIRRKLGLAWADLIEERSTA